MHRPVESADSAQISVLLTRASHCLNTGHPAGAIPALQEATRIAPGEAAIHHDPGFLCLQAGRLPEAILAPLPGVAGPVRGPRSVTPLFAATMRITDVKRNKCFD